MEENVLQTEKVVKEMAEQKEKTNN